MKTAHRPIPFLIALATLAAPSLADNITVPTDLPLSVAVATAQSGDTITLLPSGSPYLVFPGVQFANKQLTIRGSTGNPADVVIDAANLDIVMRITGSGADGSIIEGLTLRHGLGANSSEASGAGIFIDGADVTVRDCIIHDCVIPGIEGNGAGIYANASNLVVSRTRILNNRVDGHHGDAGGAFIRGGSALFSACDFIGNAGGPDATSLGGSGGAIYIENAAGQFTRCLLQENTAEGGAAAHIGVGASVTLDACRIVANQARFGAGIQVGSTATRATLRNSLVINNQTLDHSAALYADRPLNVHSTTFAGNTSAGNHLIGSGASDRRIITADNCIIWGNTFNAGIAQGSGTNTPVLRHCLVQTAYSPNNGSAGNTVADPLFVNAPAGDFHLQHSSPAIDAGDSSLYSGPFADLDATPRAVDVPDIADTGFAFDGPVIDIGALEFQVAPPPSDCPPDFNRDGNLNSQDFFDFLTAFFTGC